MIEEVNDLKVVEDDEYADGNLHRPRDRSNASKQSDGMGSLSQQMLDEGDPIENARRKDRLAKLLPKGYLKPTV